MITIEEWVARIKKSGNYHCTGLMSCSKCPFNNTFHGGNGECDEIFKRHRLEGVVKVLFDKYSNMVENLNFIEGL